jgi:hypothetical protein
MKLRNLFGSLLILAITSSASLGANVAFTEGGIDASIADPGVYGFNFTLTDAINVESLGFYGLQMGGDLPKIELIDITTNTVLATATFTTTPSSDTWNYLTLSTPVTLTVGDTYQIAASAWWSKQYTDTSAFTFGEGIVSQGYYVTAGWQGWDFSGSASTLDSTPNVVTNMTYEVAIPEPSTISSVMLGFAGLAVCLCKRKQRRA